MVMFLKRIKIMIKTLIGKEFITKLDIRLPVERIGSAYGGWDVIPSLLNSDSNVLSFGVGEDISFDLGLIERFNLAVHAFDPTPRSIAWVEKQDLPGQFFMHRYGIAAFDGDVVFYPPQNDEHVSYSILGQMSPTAEALSAPVKRLDTILSELGFERIDLLKMDIEGAEYDVVDDLRHMKIQPRQILIEFHHRFPGVGIQKSKTAIQTLRALGYKLFSISAANEEFCFVLRDE